MGKVKANGIEFYYEIYGEGMPLVLLEGLGYASWMWYRQIDALSKHFKVIVFDNRGVGETDKPDMEYTIELFADDTIEVLEALGVEKTHILGVSMGGFIAQEFSIKYPDKVDKLILCSTSFGGPNSIPIPEESLQVLMKGGGEYKSPEDVKEAISIGLDEKNLQFRQDVVNRILEEKVRNPQPRYAYQRQLMAGASFNAEERVNKIKAETLILAGSGDRVVPPENARLLHMRIANSRVEIIDGAGHLFFMEEPDITNKLIIDFLL